MATRLGEEDADENNGDASEDGEEPKDGSPTERLGEKTSYHWTESRGEHDGDDSETDILPPLGRSNNIRNDSHTQRNRTTRPGRLKTPESQKRAITRGKCKTDVGADVDGEADEVRGPSTTGVSEGADEHGDDALEDHVGGDGQVDFGVGHGEVFGDGGEGWEVDLGGEGGEEGCQGGGEDDETFLPCCEDGVGGRGRGFWCCLVFFNVNVS